MLGNTRHAFFALLSLSCSGAFAPAQTIAPDGALVYPEGIDVPRGESAAEREWLATHALPPVVRGPGEIPQGQLSCPGEYDPSEGILFAWEGSGGLITIQVQMIRWITTTGGAKAYVVFDTTSERDSQLPVIQAGGADMTKVVSYVRTTDSIWIRDYGPRFTFEGNVRVISDHTYNRPTRVNDNTLPIGFASFLGRPLYTLPLIHGGGNYHLNSLGEGFATQLIVNENPGVSQQQVIDRWSQHWGPVTTITLPFPTSVDSTQHIDMWMQIIADRKVMISDWPNNAGSTQDTICDAWAANLANAGWQVTRVPAFSIGGVHYTFTNVVMCNDLVLIPSYTNASVSPSNAAALAAYQNALPGKTIVQVNCEAIVSLAGVMHCIVMHVPKHRGAEGGLAPTAYLRVPSTGGSYSPGLPVQIRWISDDDVGVVSADLDLSTNAGASWGQHLATGISNTGTFNWVVPNLLTSRARIRITVRDADGRTSSDESDTDFTIAGLPCPADLDDGLGLGAPDGGVDVGDLLYFLNVFEAGAADADLDDDGVDPAQPDGGVDVSDLLYFLVRFESGC